MLRERERSPVSNRFAAAIKASGRWLWYRSVVTIDAWPSSSLVCESRHAEHRSAVRRIRFRGQCSRISEDKEAGGPSGRPSCRA